MQASALMLHFYNSLLFKKKIVELHVLNLKKKTLLEIKTY